MAAMLLGVSRARGAHRRARDRDGERQVWHPKEDDGAEKSSRCAAQGVAGRGERSRGAALASQGSRRAKIGENQLTRTSGGSRGTSTCTRP